MWLQSNERYDSIVDYSHSTATFSEVSRISLGENSPSRTDGFYSILSSTFAAIYCLDNALFVRIGGSCFALSDEITISVDGEAEDRTLLVLKAGKEISKLSYALDMSDQIENDPTPFVEKEDFDFGLFLSNISKSESRKRVLLGLD